MPPDHSAFKRAVVANTLRACELFSDLPTRDLEEIAAFTVFKNLDHEELLFHEGSPSDGFYVVQHGAIKVHRVSAAGKEQVIQVFQPFQSFAEAALTGAGGYPADARAIGETTVLLIPKIHFLELLRHRPELALRMLGSMSQHLRVVVGLLDDLTLKDMETRLANWLLKRCPQPLAEEPVAFELDRTKRVLAAELGATSETLSRTLAKFRDKKLLRIKGRHLTITRPRELARLLKAHLGEL